MRRSRFQDVFSLVASQVTGTPFLILRDDIAAMRELLKDLLSQQKFDFVHADQLWMAQYVLPLRKLQDWLKTVLDQHNAVFLIPQRLATDTHNPLKRIGVGHDIEIAVVGPRPGENAEESLIGPAEHGQAYDDIPIIAITPVRLGRGQLQGVVDRLSSTAAAGNQIAARSLLLDVASPAAQARPA
jgi:hypothetical protein